MIYCVSRTPSKVASFSASVGETSKHTTDQRRATAVESKVDGAVSQQGPKWTSVHLLPSTCGRITCVTSAYGVCQTGGRVRKAGRAPLLKVHTFDLSHMNTSHLQRFQDQTGMLLTKQHGKFLTTSFPISGARSWYGP